MIDPAPPPTLLSLVVKPVVAGLPPEPLLPPAVISNYLCTSSYRAAPESADRPPNISSGVA